MTGHALPRGDKVVGVSGPGSVGKLADVADRLRIVPGRADDRGVIRRAVEGCDGAVTLREPFGVKGYATGTAQAVLQCADPEARLNLPRGWYITRDGKDAFSRSLRWQIRMFTPLARGLRFADLADQVRACDRIFASDRRSSAVPGDDLKKGPRGGMPVWQRHVGDLALARNRTPVLMTCC